MNFRYLRIFYLFIACLIAGCAVGHQDYVSFRNAMVGKKIPYSEPFKFKNSGALIRGGFVIAGQGLTHITKDHTGNLIYHLSDQEVLPNANVKEWVGQCLVYYVVDPETYVVKKWGFDEGSNPLSCRSWP